MNASGDANTTREVWRFIQDFNRTWTEGDPRQLRSFFDPDAIIIHPGFRGRTVGRDAAVASYVDFCVHAKVLSFAERDPDVDVNDNVAVVSYTFDIGYEINGERHREQGRDMFVLRRENKRWRALWRTLLPQYVE